MNRCCAEYRLEYGLTPEQYHAGLDKLWEALELTEVQNEDVFTLAARAIKEGNLAQRKIDIIREI